IVRKKCSACLSLLALVRFSKALNACAMSWRALIKRKSFFLEVDLGIFQRLTSRRLTRFTALSPLCCCAAFFLEYNRMSVREAERTKSVKAVRERDSDSRRVREQEPG